MYLEEEINKFIETIPEKIEYIDTEETTKISLITPLLRILGYDTADPRAVKAEYTADIGTKKLEKVDIAILIDDEPEILIECKKANDKLRKDHISQLYRYYNVTSAKFAVLTNGVEYMFFADSNNDGQMDNDPFLYIDLLDASKKDIKELIRFSRSIYDQDKLYSSVEVLKYTTLTKEYLENQINDPSDELARVIGKAVHDGVLHHKRLDMFKEIIPSVFKSIIDDRVEKRLQKAIRETEEETEEKIEEVEDEKKRDSNEYEKKALEILKEILSDVYDPNRLFLRVRKYHSRILLDDNQYKTLLILYFNNNDNFKIGLVDMDRKKDNGGLMEDKKNINNVNDLKYYETEIINSAKKY
ncbi:MAG: type I restriction enzyme HsdR N-terminal domain-containing protein [Methanobrevibacter sp.]|nr:type I restriction enzyme HsdR N-terminal domain-containing protein [Candidatus Methanovirga meridionalis]